MLCGLVWLAWEHFRLHTVLRGGRARRVLHRLDEQAVCADPVFGPLVDETLIRLRSRYPRYDQE